LDSGIPGFGCPEVVFLLIEFSLRQQNIMFFFCFFSRNLIFCC
jgi:hypothetical protein